MSMWALPLLNAAYASYVAEQRRRIVRPCAYCGRSKQVYGKMRKTCDGCGAPRNESMQRRELEVLFG